MPEPPVLAALGPFTSALITMLEASAPGESFVALPAEGEPPVPSDVLVTFGLSPDDLDRAVAAGVAWIHVLGTGVDGFPLDRAAGRTVTCSRGASGVPIAEFVLAAMLAFEKQLPEVWVSEPPAQWNLAGLGGLAGRTLGLVGLGAIGTEVARRAVAFDMRVLASRRRAGTPAPPGVTVAPLAEVLAAADHLVIAAPATAATRDLVDAEALAACKPGVHLVNVARGSLVDQEALLAALDRGTVARATLDVVEPEPLPAGHPLYTHPRVRLSPHISWSAPGSIERNFGLFVDNLRRYRAGEPLEGIVDPEAGY